MSDRFRELETPSCLRTRDIVLMAMVTSYESNPHPARDEQRQFAELFIPVFNASSPEARRNAVAALSRCPVVPRAVSWFIATRPIELAAIFLTGSVAIDDDMLITVARTQGEAHARAVAHRANLSVRVIDALVDIRQGVRGLSTARDRMDDVQGISPAAIREEQMRSRLKEMVYRDTVVREEEHDEAESERAAALLVRFARLGQPHSFSHTLARLLDCSQWLTNRILLDLSGLQLASALINLGMDEADILVVLGSLYPHLAVWEGGRMRAKELLSELDRAECEDRVRLWIRADNELRGIDNEKAANINSGVMARELPRRRA